MDIELLKNLTDKELEYAAKLYEKVTGRFFLPTDVPEQLLWISAFEHAKRYFEPAVDTIREISY